LEKVNWLRAIFFCVVAAAGSQAWGQIHSEATPDLEAGVVWSLGKTGSEVGVKDFTVALLLDGAGEGTLVGEPGKWGVTRAGERVRFEMIREGTAVELETVLGGARTVVVSVKRDPRQALSGLWVDGVERMSVAVAPGELRVNPTAIVVGEGVKGARLFDRALSRGEVLEWGAVNSASGGDSVVWMGGSEACALYEDGRLEAALLLRGMARRVRSLAWEGDTVFRQDRPMGFGSLKSQLDRVRAGEVWLMFGRQEALEMGSAGAAAFREGLGKLVAEVKGLGRQVRVVGVAPLELRGAPFPDLSAQAAVVAAYEQVAAEVAAAAGVEMVRVQERWPGEVNGNFTRDGLTLNARGLEWLAGVLTGGAVPGEKDEVVAGVKAKNRLWESYWRPTNWAFLHGDRTAQPSSRDHADPRQRWFPTEMEGFKVLIETKEQELWNQVNALGRKLP
jgi:hypothetical protein